MSTYLDIQNRVLSRLIDTPGAVRAEVPILVNEALRTLMKMHDWKCMEAYFAVTTNVAVSSTGSHALCPRPADWKIANGKPYFLADPTSRSRNIEWRTDRRLVLDTYGAREGYPRAMIDVVDITKSDGTSNFELYPLADGTSNYPDGEYRISIPYYRWLPLFVNGADSNWFSLYCDLFLIYRATADGFLMDWDPSNASIWEQEATREYAKLVKADKLREMGNVQTLEIRTTGARRD